MLTPHRVLSLSLAALIAGGATTSHAQDTNSKRFPRSAALGPRNGYTPKTSRADTLRGSFTTPGRAWWDASFYDLHVAINPSDSSIKGYNAITYRVLKPGKEMQIDLMTPLEVDSMTQDGKAVPFKRDGAAFFPT